MVKAVLIHVIPAKWKYGSIEINLWKIDKSYVNLQKYIK